MPAPRGLVQQLDQQLHENGLLPRGARLLVACSGGADSVALLRLLDCVNQSKYWNWGLYVGHVNHGLRGAESDEDAVFVQNLAATLHLPYSSRPLHFPRDFAVSEDAARRERFAALAGMAQTFGCNAIVLGHHAGDQAETVLLRMLRGCGVHGLGAIRARSQLAGCVLLRPLLHIPRAALLEFLALAQQPFRTDSTNATPIYLRNRVRLHALPMLRELTPEIDAALVRLAGHAAEADEAIAQMGRTLARDARCPGGGYERPLLRAAPAAVLRWLLHKLVQGRAGGGEDQINAGQMNRAVALVRGRNAGQLEFARGRRLIVGRTLVKVVRAKETQLLHKPME